jgi:hypothetical protein
MARESHCPPCTQEGAQENDNAKKEVASGVATSWQDRRTPLEAPMSEQRLKVLVDDLFVPAFHQVLVPQLVLGHRRKQIADFALVLLGQAAV